MKNLKKVLALVLAFACAFTMFAGAVVYPDVPAGSEYSEAITMLSDLGIIQGKTDGKYHADESITRAEACALIARMLTGDPDVSQYAGASNFTDVVKGTWQESVVGYCVVNGITVGVGNNKFEPNRPITDAEFVTMVVRAMGYETTGTSYPYGHISAAQANGLLDDVTVIPSSPAERGEDAQIIYNALFADYARGAKQINTTHGTTVEEYPTIAEDVFDLAKASVGNDKNVYVGLEDDSKVKCEAHTWVILGVNAAKADTFTAAPIEDGETTLYAKPEQVDFVYTGDMATIEALRGYKVELWGETQHKTQKPEIKAVKTVKGQTAYGNDIEDVDDTPDYDKVTTAYLNLKTAEYDKYGEITKVTYTKDFIADKNAAYTIKTKVDFEKAMDDQKDSAIYRLVDWDSDGEVDFALADKVAYAEVDKVTSKKISLKSNKATYVWDIDDDDLYTVDVNGAEADDIVEIVETRAYDSKQKQDVLTYTLNVVESETAEYTKRSTKPEIFFDGEVKTLAGDGEWDVVSVDANDLTKDNLKYDFNLWYDRNGNVIKAELADETAKGYLMVLDTANGETKFNKEKNAAIKAILGDNTVAKFDIATSMKDVTIDKTANNPAYDKSERNFDESQIVGKAFKYYVNDDGEITKLTQVAVKSSKDTTAAGLYSYLKDRERITIDGTNYTLVDDDVIFAVKPGYVEVTGGDKEVDPDNVLAVKVADIPDIYANTNDANKCEAAFLDAEAAPSIMYDVNDEREVTAAIMGVDSFKYFANTSIKPALVTRAYEESGDKRGESIFTLKAAMDGKYEELSTVSVESLEDLIADGDDIDEFDDLLEAGKDGIGMYAELSFNSDGKITEINPMEKKGDTYEGAVYHVVRRVVDKVRDGKDVSTLDAVVAAEKKLYTAYSPDDKTGSVTGNVYDLSDDTGYYTVDEYPAVVAGEKLKVTDGFKKGVYSDLKAGEAADLASSVIYNSNNKIDVYNVADLILKDDDVIGVVCFAKTMSEDGEQPAEDATYTVVKVVKKAAAPAVPDSYKTTIAITKDVAANKTGKVLFKLVSASDNTYDAEVVIDNTTSMTKEEVARSLKDAIVAKHLKATVEGNTVTITTANKPKSVTVTPDEGLATAAEIETVKVEGTASVAAYVDLKVVHEMKKDDVVKFGFGNGNAEVTVTANAYMSKADIANKIAEQVKAIVGKNTNVEIVKGTTVRVTGTYDRPYWTQFNNFGSGSPS